MPSEKQLLDDYYNKWLISKDPSFQTTENGKILTDAKVELNEVFKKLETKPKDQDEDRNDTTDVARFIEFKKNHDEYKKAVKIFLDKVQAQQTTFQIGLDNKDFYTKDDAPADEKSNAQIFKDKIASKNKESWVEKLFAYPASVTYIGWPVKKILGQKNTIGALTEKQLQPTEREKFIESLSFIEQEVVIKFKEEKDINGKATGHMSSEPEKREKILIVSSDQPMDVRMDPAKFLEVIRDNYSNPPSIIRIMPDRSDPNTYYDLLGTNDKGVHRFNISGDAFVDLNNDKNLGFKCRIFFNADDQSFKIMTQDKKSPDAQWNDATSSQLDKIKNTQDSAFIEINGKNAKDIVETVRGQFPPSIITNGGITPFAGADAGAKITPPSP